MKLNKKGFTLIELLAVIVILAIILVITIPTVLSSMDNAKKSAFDTAIATVQTYVQNEYDKCVLGDSTLANYDTTILNSKCELKNSVDELYHNSENTPPKDPSDPLTTQYKKWLTGTDGEECSIAFYRGKEASEDTVTDALITAANYDLKDISGIVVSIIDGKAKIQYATAVIGGKFKQSDNYDKVPTDTPANKFAACAVGSD